MLRVENLDVFYGDVQALNGVSLEIEQGMRAKAEEFKAAGGEIYVPEATR